MDPGPADNRSFLTKRGRFAVGVFFAILTFTLPFVQIDPDWLRWALFAVAVCGLLVVGFCRAEKGAEEETLVQVAQQAIRNEAIRLDSKRRNLEKVLIAYGELMEFPDFEQLQTIDWQDEAHVGFDKRVADLLDAEADLVLQRFSSGVYWTSGGFESRQMLLDLVSFTESVARVYQPESERPLLEVNLESLFKAVNRTSLQIILLLEELPILELQQMNLRKMSEHIRKASKVHRTYEDMQPYLRPVRYLWQSSKMFMMTNPLLAAGWIAGSELIWKGGKHLGKKAMDAYLLSLVRQSLGIVAWETAGIYDATHRYRSPDWVYGVELAHLLSQFEATQDVLREAFRELGRLPLRSTYDRIFLYRCIAQNASPKPNHFAQPESLPEDTRRQLRKQLLAFYERNVSSNSDAENAETVKWREGLDERLGLKAPSA
ncbi:MAG: hypothetical protein WD342_13650 [Verrucomicrobiales bacterium]